MSAGPLPARSYAIWSPSTSTVSIARPQNGFDPVSFAHSPTRACRARHARGLCARSADRPRIVPSQLRAAAQEPRGRPRNRPRTQTVGRCKCSIESPELSRPRGSKPHKTGIRHGSDTGLDAPIGPKIGPKVRRDAPISTASNREKTALQQGFWSGASRTRTGDLLGAIQALASPEFLLICRVFAAVEARPEARV